MGPSGFCFAHIDNVDPESLDLIRDEESAALAQSTANRLSKHLPESSGGKSPAALLALAGLRDATEVSKSVLKKDGSRDLSTFHEYYVLNALAKSGDINTGLDFISQYWAVGTFPTPKGPIRVRHERQPDGRVKSEIELPENI